MTEPDERVWDNLGHVAKDVEWDEECWIGGPNDPRWFVAVDLRTGVAYTYCGYFNQDDIPGDV